MHHPMPRIYCCFIHFILFLSYPRSTKLKRGTLVSPCPSVCGQNRVRCASSTIQATSISYLHHLINQLQKVCHVLSFVKNSKIWIFDNFFKFAPFTLSCDHIMWMLKVDSASELLLQQLLIFCDDTSRCFTKHTFRVWPKLQFYIFGKCLHLYLFA